MLSRLQRIALVLGGRRLRFIRRWIGGVWMRKERGWKHHLEMVAFEKFAVFPAAVMALSAPESAVARNVEVWSQPAELPAATVVRIGPKRAQTVDEDLTREQLAAVLQLRNETPYADDLEHPRPTPRPAPTSIPSGGIPTKR
jgi:hypothetical protein